MSAIIEIKEAKFRIGRNSFSGFEDSYIVLPLVARVDAEPQEHHNGQSAKIENDYAKANNVDCTYSAAELLFNNSTLVGTAKKPDDEGYIYVNLPTVTYYDRYNIKHVVVMRNIDEAHALIKTLKEEIEDFYKNYTNYVKTI